MAGSTSRAEPTYRGRVRAALALLLVGALLAGCALFQREPHASQDVLDAIYAGIKRAQERPS